MSTAASSVSPCGPCAGLHVAVEVVDERHELGDGGVVAPAFEVVGDVGDEHGDGHRSISTSAAIGSPDRRVCHEIGARARPAARPGRGTGAPRRSRRPPSRRRPGVASGRAGPAAARRHRGDSRISSGATRLPFDFDIFSPSRRIMPWVNRRWNGSRSRCGTRPRSDSALVKKRAYMRCSTACSAPPMYWSTGSHLAISSERNGTPAVAIRAAAVGEAQVVPGRVDERVHRVGLPAGRPAARRARRVEEPVVEGERRLAGGSELDVVGSEHRQLVLGHRLQPAVVAVDDRDRATPEPLAAQQPVAQPVGDLGLADALALRASRWPSALASATSRPFEPLAVDGRTVAGVRLAVEVVGWLHGADDLEAVGRWRSPSRAGPGRARP